MISFKCKKEKTKNHLVEKRWSQRCGWDSLSISLSLILSIFLFIYLFISLSLSLYIYLSYLTFIGPYDYQKIPWNYFFLGLNILFIYLFVKFFIGPFLLGLRGLGQINVQNPLLWINLEKVIFFVEPLADRAPRQMDPPIIRETAADTPPILRKTLADTPPILRETLAETPPISRETLADIPRYYGKP